jgi:hypothetical protein
VSASIVGSTTATAASASAVSVVRNGVTVGNSLLLSLSSWDAASPAANSTPIESWTLDVLANDAGGDRASVHRAHSVSGGNYTVTATGTTGDYFGATLTEVVDLINAAPLLVTSATGNSDTPVSGTTASTAPVSEAFAIACVAIGGQTSAHNALGITTDTANGWVNQGRVQTAFDIIGHSADTRIITVSGTQSHPWGTISHALEWVGVIAVYAAKTTALGSDGLREDLHRAQPAGRANRSHLLRWSTIDARTLIAEVLFWGAVAGGAVQRVSVAVVRPLAQALRGLVATRAGLLSARASVAVSRALRSSRVGVAIARGTASVSRGLRASRIAAAAERPVLSAQRAKVVSRSAALIARTLGAVQSYVVTMLTFSRSAVALARARTAASRMVVAARAAVALTRTLIVHVRRLVAARAAVLAVRTQAMGLRILRAVRAAAAQSRASAASGRSLRSARVARSDARAVTGARSGSVFARRAHAGARALVRAAAAIVAGAPLGRRGVARLGAVTAFAALAPAMWRARPAVRCIAAPAARFAAQEIVQWVPR